MSREIKFRAWDNVEMKMHYTGEEDNIHFYFDSNGIVAERFYNEEVCEPEGERDFYGNSENLEHLKYLEYTGLKDKKDVGIYEGDIVDCFYPKRNDITHTLLGNVAFIDGCWFITESKRNYFSTLYSEFESIEVIGNIYEHPHLLEESK